MSTVQSQSVSSSTPDYTDPTFRGALTSDHWVADDDAFAMVPATLIADVYRASDAIATISRLVHNSSCEPEMSNAEPLGQAAHLGLLNAAELIGQYLTEVADRMVEGLQLAKRARDSAEVSHD
ncbi:MULTISPECIES: hypothetical protein [Burkholderia cepacia complex]|uniref:DUF3077 domain-containing protein n=1 Tax=Burkholderia ubonensis TaxID=101571 RepID=A0A1B4LBT5_9BURK|nr:MULTISPECIES: hypothetical protein [Burkholderia cepacia complex]AOJ74664.1 hypothetical protein WJ35_05975 [Burkholderia ubonensis]AOK09740.1 hypothetical protein WK31_05525 [Burkholderia vietnamiensis]